MVSELKMNRTAPLPANPDPRTLNRDPVYNRHKRFSPVKRNTIVLGVTLILLAACAWAGWANWEYRKQAAERMLASASHADLVPAVAGDVPSQQSLVGKPAPDFVLENLSGQAVSLSSFKGKPLLINFWATWCGPCKIETPWLIELQNQYAAKGFQIVGISTEGDDLQPGDKDGWAHDKAAIAKFVKEYHMQYPVLVNGDSLATEYGGLDAMPTSIYVNREGKVVAMQLGISSKEDMAADIEKTL
jgi:cytochrome c biogenesis protein CcmG/thiol:disulfide interchange protein DsbE